MKKRIKIERGNQREWGRIKEEREIQSKMERKENVGMRNKRNKYNKLQSSVASVGQPAMFLIPGVTYV